MKSPALDGLVAVGAPMADVTASRFRADELLAQGAGGKERSLLASALADRRLEGHQEVLGVDPDTAHDAVLGPVQGPAEAAIGSLFTAGHADDDSRGGPHPCAAGSDELGVGAQADDGHGQPLAPHEQGSEVMVISSREGAIPGHSHGGAKVTTRDAQEAGEVCQVVDGSALRAHPL
jgi:hypothetical protein